MLKPLSIVGIAVLLSSALLLIPNSGHGGGTGSNNWDFRSFGWPVEAWSRSVHSQRAPESRQWVEQSKHYAVEWKTVALMVPLAFGISSIIVLCIFPAGDK
jgi:hypothetical protein